MQASREEIGVHTRGWWPLLTVTLALLLAACGGAPGATVTIQLDPTTLDLVLGDSSTVQVTITRSAAATAPLSLQADGAPAWVDVDFAPAVLSGATVTSTMTVSTDGDHPDAAAADFDLTALAVGTDLSAEATLSVSVELLDVSGTVVDGFGEPLVGVNVVASGHAGVVTDADGSFSLSGVVVPYDVTVIDSVASVAHKFEGLTTGAPRLQPISALLGGLTDDLSATITGTLSHASLLPLTAGHAVSVCAEGQNGSVRGCQQITTVGETSYTIEPTWSSPTEPSVRVRAYLYEVNPGGVPTNIVAAGSAVLILADGDNVAGLDFTLEPVSNQASMAVTTAVPAGYSLDGRSVVSHYSQFASFPLDSGTPTGASETLIAPFFSGATLSAYATASSTSAGSSSLAVAWTTGHSSGDATTLTLPTPPTALTPPDTATGVSTATEFSIANSAGGVVTFVVQPSGSGPIFAVTTEATKASIPDAAAFGLGLPGSAAYSWVVLASPHLATADDAVTGDGYFGGYLSLFIATAGGGQTPTSDGQISTSESLKFTTQ